MSLPFSLPLTLKNTQDVTNARTTTVKKGAPMVLVLPLSGHAVWISPADFIPTDISVIDGGVASEDIVGGGNGSVFLLPGLVYILTKPNTIIGVGEALTPGAAFWSPEPNPSLKGPGVGNTIAYALTAGVSKPAGDIVLALAVSTPTASGTSLKVDPIATLVDGALVKIGLNPGQVVPLAITDTTVAAEMIGVTSGTSGPPGSQTTFVLPPGVTTTAIWDAQGPLPIAGDRMGPSAVVPGMMTGVVPSAAFPLNLLTGTVIVPPVGPGSGPMTVALTRAGI